MTRMLAPALLLPALAAFARSPVPELPRKGMVIAICTPEHVFAAQDRAHVRCLESAGGILFFAAPLADKARSTQVVHKGFQAIAKGGKLRIEYDPADQTGGAWGCLVHDCRPVISVQPQQ